jgi:hypothetical protein
MRRASLMTVAKGGGPEGDAGLLDDDADGDDDEPDMATAAARAVAAEAAAADGVATVGDDAAGVAKATTGALAAGAGMKGFFAAGSALLVGAGASGSGAQATNQLQPQTASRLGNTTKGRFRQGRMACSAQRRFKCNAAIVGQSPM